MAISKIFLSPKSLFNLQISKAFTLVEISIVVIISAILFVLLAKVYMLASRLYIYHTNVKNIETDLLFFNQTLQNLADSSEIDFSAYSGYNLKNYAGFTWNLYLKDKDTKYKIFSKNWQILLLKSTSGGNTLIPLTNTGATKVWKLVFKIIPYQNPYKIFTDKNQQPFVEIFLTIENRFYNTWTWYQAVKYDLQEGFNFKYYNN